MKNHQFKPPIPIAPSSQQLQHSHTSNTPPGPPKMRNPPTGYSPLKVHYGPTLALRPPPASPLNSEESDPHAWCSGSLCTAHDIAVAIHVITDPMLRKHEDSSGETFAFPPSRAGGHANYWRGGRVECAWWRDC